MSHERLATAVPDPVERAWHRRHPARLFVILVALTTLAFVALIATFLMPVFWAAVLATVFFPLQRRLARDS